MEEKICPMTEKPCGPHCGWFVPTHDKCAMILIGDSVFPLMMSVTGGKPMPFMRMPSWTPSG